MCTAGHRLNLYVCDLSGFHRHLDGWMKRLKSSLPYYNECNDAGIETFRNWVKDRVQKDQ